MNRRIVATTLAVVALFVAGAGAQTFQSVYGTINEERAEWVDQTSDGGYIICGILNDPAGAGVLIQVLKLDSAGVIQWDTLLTGPTGVDIANRVVETVDGGYVLAGETSVSPGGNGILLLKLSSAGVFLWAHTYPGTPFAGGSAGGTALEQTSDEGFIMTGRMQGVPDAQQAFILIKTDVAGVLQWAYYYFDGTYGTDTFGSFYDVHEVTGAADGGYIVCGFVANTQFGDRRSLLVRTDSTGLPLWAKTYGIEPSYDWALGCDPAAGGDFLMTGFTKNLGEGGGTYLLRTDSAGGLLWYKTFRFFVGTNSMEETPTGDIILAGNADDFGGVQGASLLKTDAAGVFQWSWLYGGAGQEYGESVTPTTDGGYMLTAWTDSFGAGSFDIYAIKTDASGSSGCNEEPFMPLLGDDQPPVEDRQLVPRLLEVYEDLQLVQIPPQTIREILCDGGDEGPCPDLELDLATGVDDDGNLIPVGSPDDDWIVTAEPPPPGTLPRPAGVIAGSTAWLTIPGTRWISADYTGPVGDYTYEYCFCLHADFQNPLLSLDLRADDWATVFLNGNLLGVTPDPSFNTPTPSHFETGDTTLFNVGENCVTIVVSNSGGVVTGLNVAGTLFAEDGDCCEDCVTPPPGMVAWWPLDEPATGPQAEEIVNNNDGTYVNGATPGVPGMVENAVEFDGVDDLIIAADHPTLNFGPSPAGDFTIDAWIYMNTFSVAYAPIVHKRDYNGIGYYFFLLDGNPALYIGDGLSAPGHTIYCCSGPLLTPGQWYHVAVTVDRDDPAGLQHYVDGVPAGAPYDPTDRPGDLTHPHELLIGTADYEEYPGSAPSYWDGRIDEVEIFGRALDASEILAIYQAGAAGKCKETCHVPWDKRFCKNENTVTTTVTICNYSTYDHDYMLSFTGLPAGWMMGCSIDGPTSFTVVGPNPVTVPAGTCVGVPVEIDRPIDMIAAYLIGCFEVQIDNLDTGSTMTCHGSVVDRRDICTILVKYDDDVIALPAGPSLPIIWELTSTADVALDFPLQIVAYDPDMLPDMSTISLDGLPPGEPVTRTISLLPNETVDVEILAMMLAYEPFRTYDLVVETDVDGDGDYEPLTSLGLRGIPFVLGDLNCDGEVDFFDIEPFVMAITDPAGYAAAYPNCSILLADINQDGAVNFFDIEAFVELLVGG